MLADLFRRMLRDLKESKQKLQVRSIFTKMASKCSPAQFTAALLLHACIMINNREANLKNPKQQGIEATPIQDRLG